MANDTKVCSQYNPELASVKKLFKSQSAFTLIEICIALLILSLSVAWTSELLVARIPSYQKAMVREKAVAVLWSIADSVYLDPSGLTLEHQLQHWESALENILAGSRLKIQRSMQDPLCIYTIGIHFGNDLLAPLELSVFAGA